MTEKFVSDDFLSRDNTMLLYKHVTMNNDIANPTEQQRKTIIANLIDTMKKVFKTLDMSQINKNNITMVKKQFNNIVIVQTSEIIKKTLNQPDNTMNDRRTERDFTSVARPTPMPHDRPVATAFGGNPHASAPSHAGVDFMRNATADLSTRLKEVEDARRMTMDNKQPPEMPDFLKPVKVGKANDFAPPSMSMNMNMPSQQSRPLLGFNNDMDSNFSSNVPRSDPSKYSETMSTADRLKQMEAERGMAMPVQPPPNGNVNSLFSQPANSTGVPNTSAMFSNTIPTYDPQPPVNHPPPQYNQPPPQNNEMIAKMNEMMARMNEMQGVISNLKNENDYLKIQLNSSFQKKTLTKNLQLEVTKKDASYNYQFNPIHNIIGLKLVHYDLPPPIYNIVEDMKLEYDNSFICVADNPQVRIVSTQNKDGCAHHILLPKGNYNIDNLIKALNVSNLIFSYDTINQKISVTSENDFTIISSRIWEKLGFIQKEYQPSKHFIADRVYDIRPPSKLYLFIKNINQHQPYCTLNFNNNSVCDLQFPQPITLSNLLLEFYTEDGILYNFNDINYNLGFVIEILAE
jgi:hypothetical protein